MGPSTRDREIVKALIENGMDIARFNFSHGTHEEQKKQADLVKEAREKTGVPVALLLDTKGPEIRTGMLKDGKKVTLAEGQTFTLTTQETIGDSERAYITYPGLPGDVAPGARILIDDGLLELEVTAVT